MMVDPRQAFASQVLGEYRTLREAAVKAAVPHEFTKAVTHVPLGHPEFADLPLGASRHIDMASAFIDLSDFTRRSFWDPPGDMVHLARAFLTQCAYIVEERGGHVLGFRGDGLLAGFGGSGGQAFPQVACALAACAFALDATKNALNQLLEQGGVEPVIVRAGVDYGRADFVRIGNEAGSEINIVGFATNFAAKCEKFAGAWEVVIGQGAAEHVHDSLLEAADRPKVYSRGEDRRYYRYYNFRWAQIAAEAASLPELGGAPCSAVLTEGVTP